MRSMPIDFWNGVTVSTFALAIYVQKSGVRRNNWDMIDAGRMKFLPFFYGFNHPIYHEVEYRDLYLRALYPQEITDFMEVNSCYNRSSLELNYQGGDFCLENTIKKHKMVAPKGVVSNGTWRKISRGLDKIDAVLENASKILETGDKSEYKDADVYNEIIRWRAVLRSSDMLTNKEEEGVIKNIFSEPIPFELDDITVTVEEKMKEYWTEAASGTPLQNIRHQRLLVQYDSDEDSE